MIAKNIVGIVPGLMSVSFMAHTTKMLPKDWSPKGMKKVDPLLMVKGFTGIMVGIPMIGIASNQIAALP